MRRVPLLTAVLGALVLWNVGMQAQHKNDQRATGKTATVTGCLAKGDEPNYGEHQLQMTEPRMDARRDDPLQHAQSECDRVLLAAFAPEALDPFDRERMLVHLAGCGEFREMLALIAPDEGPPPAAVRR